MSSNDYSSLSLRIQLFRDLDGWKKGIRSSIYSNSIIAQQGY
jgi:hypothetical protein